MRSVAAMTVAVFGAVAGGGACGERGDDDADANRMRVVAAFYPLAWVVSQVGGDLVRVSDLTPAGGEPHDLELTPSQVAEVVDADLVVAMGAGFQPGVEAAVSDRAGTSLLVLDALARTGSLGARGAADPHVWLDAERMIAIVDAVASVMSEVDPDGRAAFARNAAGVVAELEDLDHDYVAGLSDCARRELITAHDAFGWLAERYDLEPIPIAGISPETEPSAERLGELASLVAEFGATTIFAETLVSPEIAETLADEVGGVTVAVLDPIEGRAAADVDAGRDYLDLMRSNLATLRAGLGCN
jgi:zinc transport system substrate-binding protein